MSTSRRTFLKLLGYGAVVATVPTALATRKRSEYPPPGVTMTTEMEPYYAANSLDLSKYPRVGSLEEQWAEYEAGKLRLDRYTKVGGGNRDWSWVETKREDLRRGDIFRLVDRGSNANIHIADDSYPEPDMNDNTRGLGPKGMRSVEVLAVTTLLSTVTKWSGDDPGSKRLIVECSGASQIVEEPRWEKVQWDELQPFDVFRVREANGELEKGPLAIAVANGEAYIHPDYNTWAVEVLPIEHLQVWQDLGESLGTLPRYVVRDYAINSEGNDVKWAGGASGTLVKPA